MVKKGILFHFKQWMNQIEPFNIRRIKLNIKI